MNKILLGNTDDIKIIYNQYNVARENVFLFDYFVFLDLVFLSGGLEFLS
jgi:hypothetical protein